MQPEVVLIVNEGHNGSRQIAIRTNRFTLGRSADNDLSVDDPSLSRRHALIEIFDGVAQISDCGSQNGTFVNHQPIAGSARLNDGDSIILGSACHIIVQLQNARLVPANSEGASDSDSRVGSRFKASGPQVTKTISPAGAAMMTGLGSMKVAMAAVAAILLVLTALIIFINRPTPKLTNPASESTPQDKVDAHGATGAAPDLGGGGKVNTSGEVSSEQVERAAVQVMRRISSDSKSYVFPSDALDDIKDKIVQYCKSPALIPLLRTMNTHAREIAKLAQREGMEPGLLVYLAMTDAMLRQTDHDPVAAAHKALPILLDVWKVFGSTLAEGSLLIVAAYELGPVMTVGGTSRKSHPLLSRITGSVVERNVWASHKRGKLSQETYHFVVSFVALGAIAQSPNQFGVVADPLIF